MSDHKLCTCGFRTKCTESMVVMIQLNGASEESRMPGSLVESLLSGNFTVDLLQAFRSDR